MSAAVTAEVNRIKRERTGQAQAADRKRRADDEAAILAEATKIVNARSADDRRERGRNAGREAREKNPIFTTMTMGRLVVTIETGQEEPVTRQTAEQAVGIVLNRLNRWQEAHIGHATSKALGGGGVAPASPEEIARYLMDEIRRAIAYGCVRIEVEPA